MKDWGRGYFDMMDGILAKHGLPKELKYLAVIESQLKSHAISWAGAVGPWQLMPSTARKLGLKVGSKVDERRDIYKSTQAACRYLTNLYSIYGDWLLVIAAYNGGPGKVNAAIKRSGSTDFWTLAVLVSGIGSIGTAINMVTTILCLRCPGMTLGRMPLFSWLNLVMAVLVLLAVSPLTAAQIMLMIDRYLGGHFFDVQAGGSAVMWMHFFWIFGHPEVYVLVMPAFAIVSEIIPVFSRKALFGYPFMVAAGLAIGFLAMSVWAHHMFTVGLSSTANTFFVMTTMAIGVPTGIKIFNWLATLWGGRIHFKTPMLFCLGFLFQFLIAGLTGIMLSAAPFDWQLGNSYFVVAHFHYVIVGGILFAVFGAFYYWFPKMSGKMYSETLGRLHFVLFLIGFHLTFDFMHLPGLLGMPRRIYTYEPGRGWDIWNLIVTVGVVFQGTAILVFVAGLVWAYFMRKPAGNDPWDAWTLEWTTSSPPAPYNFAAIPVVRSRRPLWDLKHPEDPDWKYDQ